MVDHSYILPRCFAVKRASPLKNSLGEPLHGAQGAVSFANWQEMTRDKAAQNGAHYGALHASFQNPSIKHLMKPLSNQLFDKIKAPQKMPFIMGILNVTDDSFSDGGQHNQLDDAVAQGLLMEQEGAAIIDVGGESTRPNARLVPTKEELARTIPVIKALRKAGLKALISIDSRKAEVMHQALEAGADIINDVSALSFDPQSIAVARDARCPVILMHAQGTPDEMQNKPHYDQVALDIYDYFKKKLDDLETNGLERQSLTIDPGFGFGKSFAHNLSLLDDLSLFHTLHVPLLVGGSRKSFIGQLTGEEDPAKRAPASVGFAVRCALQGAQILRVHDVKMTLEGLKGFGF